MRVGGLGVVDPGDPVDASATVAIRCPSGRNAAQPVADGGLRDAVRPGQRGGGQRVGHDVRVPATARSATVQSSAALDCRSGDEGPVDEQVVDDADHADAGHAEGEADGAGALDHVGVADQPLGLGVGDVVDAGPLHPLVDAALVGGVVGHRRRAGVPVEVVLGEVEHHGGLGAHRVGVVELEAGQLDGEHVVRRGVHHRLDDRAARRCRPRRCAARPRAGSRRASARSWSCRWCR